MRYDLAALTRRMRNPRRSTIIMRKIVPPATMASNLYAAGYAPIIEAWQGALPGIMDRYERALSLVTDSPEDLGAGLAQAETQANGLATILRLGISRWAQAVEAWHRGKWRAAVLVATGVDVSTLIGPADMRLTIAAAIERNVALVKSVSDQARDRIANAVFAGLKARTPPREVAKQLQEAVDMGKRRARNIAADQLTKITSDLAEERMREAGIDHYQWVHSGKLHPRESHRARNGKRYELGKPERDTPGQLPYCGCTSRAVLSLDGEF